MTKTGLIFDIKKFSLHDGPGIRTTVFFKGCPLHCLWCHNPEGMTAGPEILFNQNRCIACGQCLPACPQKDITPLDGGLDHNPNKCTACGACSEACPAEAWELAGRRMNADQVMAVIGQDIPFYRQSGGGVTFSGGEPLMQPEFLLELLDRCGKLGLHRAVDTSGYAETEALLETARRAELLLYDVKHTDPGKHLEYTGVSNQLVLDPVIPGFNDDPGNIRRLGDIALSLPKKPEISLLPYHSAAGHKYLQLGRDYALRQVQPQDRKKLEGMARELEGRGLLVKIGG
jgi:pyruvate formate lyase activating enzyme